MTIDLWLTLFGILGAFQIGWLLRGRREARISEQYADAVLDFFLNASKPDVLWEPADLCLCDECYDPKGNSSS